ncbi:MAG: site-2 protease family protein [Planctomycetota bacterium]|jgi:Zn-dependent protease
MRWSWRIGQVAGIGIFVHWTFLILIAWIVFLYVRAGAGLVGTLRGIGFLAAVFACIVLHELGHALTARRFGIQTRDITLLPIGGVARLERMPQDPTQELLVALGGPAVTFVLATLFFVLVVAIRGPLAIFDLELVDGSLLAKLLWVNGILLAFNMLPAFPMDGGRVLRAVLHYSLDYVRATQIAAAAGQVMAVLFGLLGLFIFNPFLLLIAVFVFLGAREEARSVQVRSLCEGVPVHYAMITRFRTLSPEDSLSTALDELLAGEQEDFPVVEDAMLVGLLTRADLLKGVADRGRDAPVRDVMRRDCRPVEETDTLDRTFDRMRQNGCSTLPVVRYGQLIGLVTLKNVGEWMMIQSALHRTRPRSEVSDLYAGR